MPGREFTFSKGAWAEAAEMNNQNSSSGEDAEKVVCMMTAEGRVLMMGKAPWEGKPPAVANIMKEVYYKSNPDWYYRNDDDVIHMRPDAPPEAMESYEFWKRRREYEREHGCILY